MKRWLIAVVSVIAAGLVLMLAAGLVAKSLVSGAAKDRLVSSLADAAGVPVSVASADFDLAQWFRLKPAISLEDVAIGNPAGFRAKHLLEAKRMSAQIALWPLLRKRVQVRSIAIDQPRIFVESDGQGATNIETFVKRLSKGAKTGTGTSPDPPGATGGGLAIDALHVTAGEIDFSGTSIREIDLQVAGFSAGQSCRLELTAALFGGANSRLHLQGQVGPFAADSLPLDGKLSVVISPAEIPPALRKKQFGDLLGAPGPKGRASLEASVKGDLYGAVAGPAKLVLSDILIGKDEKHLMPLTGEAPLAFSATRLMSNPTFDLKVPGASLRLGKGEWTGSSEVRIRGSMMSGAGRGAIRNVEINELLSNLTTAEGKIQGRLEVPSYSVRFAGKDADEIRNSLDGSGKLSVREGRIAALDLLASIQNALGSPRQEAVAGAKGATPFTSLTTDLSLGQRKLGLSQIVLDSPALRVTGAGAIGFDHTLNFNLDARVTGGLAQVVNRLARRDQAGEASVPLVVGGTIDSPQVRPSVSRLATGFAEGLVNSLFKKKKP